MVCDYDILIAGAGPAGCAAAYDLARVGRRVLLLDRRSFPRHKACACGLTRKTLRALRYSAEPVVERMCREVVLQEAGPRFAEGVRVADKGCEVRLRTRRVICAMAVREKFDAFCLQQTMALGAELKKIESIVRVREFATGEFAGHVEVEVAQGNGVTETLRARALIGADGSNGQMRRMVAGLDAQRDLLKDAGEGAEGIWIESRAAQLPREPPWYARGFALEATVPFEALPATLPAGDRAQDLVFDFAPISGGYGWMFPKGDHVNVGVGGFVPRGEGGAAAGEAEMTYESVTRGLLAWYIREKLGVELDRLLQAHVTGQHLGLGGHAYVPRGRVLLAGDAAGMVDPLTGEGIYSAIISGQAAAGAILASAEDASAETLATEYAERLRELQAMLAFSHDAARSFYREPGRGFRVIRKRLLRQLMLKTYADGLPYAKLLGALRAAGRAARAAQMVVD
ncbi:MAG TPA: FAD-dependent oxidoreductase [Acidobacteriaceae bacterium]|jgi:flavin-dependent dehydrogenase|nr:FAD-dependent oxidoreductase [Acidobacteriaceae bacterium]